MLFLTENKFGSVAPEVLIRRRRKFLITQEARCSSSFDLTRNSLLLLTPCDIKLELKLPDRFNETLKLCSRDREEYEENPREITGPGFNIKTIVGPNFLIQKQMFALHVLPFS